MSPTYWTASQIKTSARANGYEFVKAVDGEGPWGCRKGRRNVMFCERRDGGLSQVWVTYPVSGGSNCVYFGPRYRGKLRAVLRFLEGLDHLS
jgi:hypothetical protein